MRLTQNTDDAIDLRVSPRDSGDEPREPRDALALAKPAGLGEAGQSRVDHGF